MDNFIQPGDVITLIAPAGGAGSGSGVLVGNLFGVAAFAAPEGEGVEVATRGVYMLPKEPTAIIAQGGQVAWDAAAKLVNVPAAGRYPIGIATEAAGNGMATISVRLDGVATQAA